MVSNQALAAQRLKEERDADFLWMVVDDVTPAIRKLIPSLDASQGGLPQTDLSAAESVERVLHEFSKKTFIHIVNGIRKKRYVVGSRIVNGRRVNLHRSPTPMDLRKAVRVAVDQLQYIRRETIKEDPNQGVPMRRNLAAANKIAAMRERKRAEAKKLSRKRPIKPLTPSSITARSSRAR